MKQYIIDSLSVWSLKNDQRLPFLVEIIVLVEKSLFGLMICCLPIGIYGEYEATKRFLNFKNNLSNIKTSQIKITYIVKGGFKRSSNIKGNLLDDKLKKEISIDIFRGKGLLTNMESEKIISIFSKKAGESASIWVSDDLSYKIIKFQATKKELYDFEFKLLMYNYRLGLIFGLFLILHILTQSLRKIQFKKIKNDI